MVIIKYDMLKITALAEYMRSQGYKTEIIADGMRFILKAVRKANVKLLAA